VSEGLDVSFVTGSIYLGVVVLIVVFEVVGTELVDAVIEVDGVEDWESKEFLKLYLMETQRKFVKERGYTLENCEQPN